jgi:restriction endonuclease S subunit
LEGLEISEIRKSQFYLDNIDFRIDAEYFSKLNLLLLGKLKKVGFKKIEEFSYVTDGIHTSIDYSDKSQINLISATSPRENYFDLSRKVYISEKAHKNNPRTALKENDVIISTVGTIGNCAVVTKSILPANSDRHVGIVRINKDFLPTYVSTFLLTKYGRFQTWRESTGNVQLNLFLYKIKELKIADLSKPFQNRIETVIKKANYCREQSSKIYSLAENFLLETLGLQNFIPSKEPVNIKNLKESFLISGRLDAEYYQKKYEQIVAKIKTQNFARLGDIVKIKKSIEPGSDVYSEEGLPFLRVADYNKFGISKPQKYLSDSFCKENSKKLSALKLKKGTILFSKDGSVGNAFVVKENMNMVSSGAILHLSIKNEEQILPEYLALALNSQLVQMQAERDAGGSIILHWRVSEIEDAIVPLIDFEKQQQISDFIEESFRLKNQSEQLLNLAKTAVEKAIKENEDAAMEFIILEVKKHGLETL